MGINKSGAPDRAGNPALRKGWVVLVDLKSGHVAHQARGQARPFDAVVSDTGTYAVHFTNYGTALQGDAVVFDVSGAELYRRHYSANIYSLGISRCGRFLAVQTCNAPSSTDSKLLELRDAFAERVLFSRDPATPWSQKYAFEVEGEQVKRLWVYIDKLGRFAYDASGEFVDQEKLQRAALEKGDIAARLTAAQQLFKTSKATADLETVLAVASAAAASASPNERSWQVVGFRLQGDVLEAMGRNPEAVKAFEAALAMDPKTGVKKKLVALRKKLGLEA